MTVEGSGMTVEGLLFNGEGFVVDVLDVFGGDAAGDEFEFGAVCFHGGDEFVLHFAGDGACADELAEHFVKFADVL